MIINRNEINKEYGSKMLRDLKERRIINGQ